MDVVEGGARTLTLAKDVAGARMLMLTLQELKSPLKGMITASEDSLLSDLMDARI